RDVLVELKKAGRTILLSTHIMDQAERLCDTICLVNHGRRLLGGALRDIKSSSGKRCVQIEYEGDGSFLECPLVESRNDYGNYVEVRLLAGADPQELLLAALSQSR